MQRIIAFALAGGRVEQGDAQEVTVTLRGGPSYVPAAIPHQTMLRQDGDVVLKAYLPDVLIAEITREVEDALSQEAFDMRAAMIAECQESLIRYGADMHISEEYAVAVVDGYEGSPEHFLRRAPEIVRFLKSESLALHESEITHALHNRIRYGENDLVIVDWDGTCAFQQDGHIDAIVHLLQLANMHLLRYRMLDEDLTRSLQHIDVLIRTKAVSRVVFWNRELSRAYKEVIRIQSTSVIEFDAVIREIKLIGDWYSARLYETAARKFRLDDWRRSIREKLDTLENAYDIISQNFRISREQFFELMLQGGWLVLILLELYHIFW